MDTLVLAFAVSLNSVGVLNSFSPLPILCSLCSQPTLSWRRFLSDYNTWAVIAEVSVFLVFFCLCEVVFDFHCLLLVGMAKTWKIPGSKHTPPFSHSVAVILFALDIEDSLSQPVL